MKTWNEIRLNEEGENDDIVIDGVNVHLEQMDNNLWWLGLYKGKKRICFYLVADQGGIKCELTENGLKTKIVEYSTLEEDALKQQNEFIKSFNKKQKGGG